MLLLLESGYPAFLMRSVAPLEVKILSFEYIAEPKIKWNMNAIFISSREKLMHISS